MDFGVGKNNAVWTIAKTILTLYFVLAFLYPLALVLDKAVLGGLNPQKVFRLFFSNKHLLWNSFFQASASTFFSALIGIPFGVLLARRDFPLKKFVKSLTLIPFVLPSILVVLAFIIVFGNNGWVNFFLTNYFSFPAHIQFLYGIGGVILAHVFYNFPIIGRFVSNALENADASMKEAAKTLGARRFNIFFQITVPQLAPAILAGSSIVFVYSFMSFAIVLALGGIEFSTLEVEIYRQITRNLDLKTGALLALLQFFVLLIVSTAYLFFSKKIAFKEKHLLEKPKKLFAKTFSGLAETAFLLASALFLLVPILSLFVFSVSGREGFSLRAFEKIFLQKNVGVFSTAPLFSVFFSIAFATASAAIATAVGLIASLKQARNYLVEIFLNASIAVTVISLGFGYLLAFGSGSFLAIAFGHSVLAFPFAFRAIKSALEKIDQESIDAAKTLGAKDAEVFRFVQFPRIKSALLSGFAFCFAVSLGELGLVLILFDGFFPTMPVYIYRMIATFDIFAAAAMGVVLIFISFLSFYIIERFSKEAAVI